MPPERRSSRRSSAARRISRRGDVSTAKCATKRTSRSWPPISWAIATSRTLISKGFLEGYYYKPRIDLDLLAKHHDGLIVLSGCMSGMVASPLLKNDYATSVKNAKTFVDIFGDRFYIEVMRHGMPEEEIINEGLIKVARELNLPIVATNDSHYLEQRDAPAHDVLLCIGTGKTVSDTSRMKFYSDQFYVKSAEEIATRCGTIYPKRAKTP